mmetsp:Transcript_38710/g.84204  ORF Transcript_38710/g.84204 Transcript_38710/m.84204 type:complete len:287 (+) Transcript_38710:2625-3485(+)
MRPQRPRPRPGLREAARAAEAAGDGHGGPQDDGAEGADRRGPGAHDRGHRGGAEPGGDPHGGQRGGHVQPRHLAALRGALLAAHGGGDAARGGGGAAGSASGGPRGGGAALREGEVGAARVPGLRRARLREGVQGAGGEQPVRELEGVRGGAPGVRGHAGLAAADAAAVDEEVRRGERAVQRHLRPRLPGALAGAVHREAAQERRAGARALPERVQPTVVQRAAGCDGGAGDMLPVRDQEQLPRVCFVATVLVFGGVPEALHRKRQLLRERMVATRGDGMGDNSVQ